MNLTAIFIVLAVMVLAGVTYGQDAERLYGVWEMTYYSRAGQVVDWTGIMIITPKYFTRNYMARQRPSFRDEYESLVDLPEREKDDMLEALYSKYGSASGTYTVGKRHPDLRAHCRWKSRPLGSTTLSPIRVGSKRHTLEPERHHDPRIRCGRGVEEAGEFRLRRNLCIGLDTMGPKHWLPPWWRAAYCPVHQRLRRLR